VATYETEEEQIEAIKKWWKENGLSVIGGIVIGLGLIAGWRWWQVYSDQQAQVASHIYNQILFSLEKEEIPEAHQAASQLLSEYSGSPYAVLAALNMAHHDLEKGDIDSSHARLQWVIENSDIVELAHVARLRKARLFLSQEKVAETKKLIEGIDETTFRGAYAEIRGDIAMAEGRLDDARNAYTEAVGHLDLSPQHREWVQMKLDDLGLKKEKRIEASAPTFEPSTDKVSTLPPVVPPPATESPLAIEQPSPTLSTEVSEQVAPIETDETANETAVTTETPSVPETVAAPVETDETAVTTESEPVAPVETEETPVTTESEPVAPVETEETPVTTESEPVAPVETEETAVTTDSEPVAPVETEETAVTTESEPVAPVETEETAVTTDSEPVAPVETEETAVTTESEPVAPVETEETAVTTESEPVAPVETDETAENTPVTTESMHEPVAPVETEETAVTTESEPVAPVDETPVTTDSEPVAPVETEETAVTTESEPVAPVETEETAENTPVTTEESPSVPETVSSPVVETQSSKELAEDTPAALSTPE